MKTKFLPVISAATLLAGLACAQAQYATQYVYEPLGSFYVNGDLGGNLLQNIKVKDSGQSMSFNPGVRGDFRLGWQFLPQLAVEFESGVLWNSLSSQNGLNPGTSVRDADYYQIPFLANLVFTLPLPRGFSLYAGAGAGGVESELALRDDNGYGSGYYHRHDTDNDFTFAYQGMVGVKYAIFHNMDVGVGYKFLGTLDHSFFGNDGNLAIQTGAAYSHSILASFTFRF